MPDPRLHWPRGVHAAELLRVVGELDPALLGDMDVALEAVRDWLEAGCPGYPLQRASRVDSGLWLCLCPDDENTCTDQLGRCDDCGATRPEGA